MADDKKPKPSGGGGGPDPVVFVIVIVIIAAVLQSTSWGRRLLEYGNNATSTATSTPDEKPTIIIGQ